jgi:hypothetical protein
MPLALIEEDESGTRCISRRFEGLPKSSAFHGLTVQKRISRANVNLVLYRRKPQSFWLFAQQHR